MMVRRMLVTMLVALAVMSCRPRVDVRPVPQRRMATVEELSIYRMLAESTYVKSTGRPVTVLLTSLDSACTESPCTPAARRWGLEIAWWASVADSQSVRAAHAALLARAADTIDLRTIGEGHPQIIVVTPKEIPHVFRDERAWGEYQYYHRGAAGVLRFSPIGFTPSRKAAVVFLDWECGPKCGHTLAAAVRVDSASRWQIADMLLLSSRQGPSAPHGF